MPKSSKDAVEGVTKDASGKRWLKVRVTTAPEDGKATKAVLKLLAKTWKIPASTLEVISGETSRHKRIRVSL